MQFFKNIFFTNRFFYFLFGIATLFVLAFFFEGLFWVTKIVFYLFVAIYAWDFLFLFIQRKAIIIERNYPEKLSNGDLNDFEIKLTSNYPIQIKVEILEEIPTKLQIRDFSKKTTLKPQNTEIIHYQLRPTKRGLYEFGKCVVMVQHLGLLERRISHKKFLEIPCYPSFIQLRKYILMASTNRLEELGVKRIRKIGASLEFERIKEYTTGDEYRFINWKASGKTRKLMVNQYEDEKSQPIYSFIDTGRSMRMPFREMTLLDYAINATLVLSNVTIHKSDKAGMLTFSKKIDNHVVADKRNHQMNLISERLYKIETDFKETEFGRLYAYAKGNINQRSLIFLYTNFETLDAMYRQLPYLKLLNKSHIIVVVVFKNSELESLAHKKASKTIEIYNQIIAEKFNYEKAFIIQALKANGLQTIFTEPQHLTINSINKYLEIKSRGLI